MAENEVTLTIDGQSVTVPKGTMVVDAAKSAGIEIPVFCYHDKLAMAVGPDMVVKTDTPQVEKAQKGVLEFTLLNHPLDCPVCDKGGECPLQNNTFKYGPGDTRMEFIRAENDKAKPLSPVITIDNERCIACQRCTRYSEVIEQDQGLVMLNRGFHNKVSTFNNQPYDSRFSGNVIDICPVGALTNTQFRFKARSWDLTNSDTLCAHCACNCNMTLGSRVNGLMRIESRPNDYVDDGWICDKARWGYSFIESSNRIFEARDTGADFGQEFSIEDAAKQVAESLKKIVEEHGSRSVGFIGSPYGTNEELYLYQKLFRQGLGTNNIDHKVYADSPGLPIDHYDLNQLEDANLILLIASDPTEELPILDLRIKKVVSRKGAKLAVLNDQKTLMDKYAEQSLRYNVGSSASALAGLANGLAKELGVAGGPDVNDLQASTGIDEKSMQAFVELVRTSMKIAVVYNPAALEGNAIAVLKNLLTVIQQIPTIECGAIPAAPQTNAVGAMDMGILPDYYPGGLSVTDTATVQEKWGENAPTTKGLSAMEMIEKAESGELKALLIYRSNPLVDFPGGKKIEAALKKLDLLVVHEMLETETCQLAHIVLPSNGPGYDEGTTTNIGGRVQYRKRGLNTSSAPDWKIISMMAKALGDETDYRTSFSVTDEIASKVPGYEGISKKSIKKLGQTRVQPAGTNGAGLALEDAGSNGAGGSLRLRVATLLFAHDKILDASSKLAHHFQASTVHLHEEDAGKLGVAQDDEVNVVANGVEVKAQVVVSNRCNPGAVVLPRVSDEQGVLGLLNPNESVTWVEIRKG
jgi:predicted molibdopterin-dependent oxidoreductase YjgC